MSPLVESYLKNFKPMKDGSFVDKGFLLGAGENVGILTETIFNDIEPVRDGPISNMGQ